MWRRLNVVPGLFTILAPAIVVVFVVSIAKTERAQSIEPAEPPEIDGWVVQNYPAGDLLENIQDRLGSFGPEIFGENAKDYLVGQLNMACVSGSSSFLGFPAIRAAWHGKDLAISCTPEMHRRVERHLETLRSSNFERLEASVRFVAIRPEQLLALPVDWKIIPPQDLDVALGPDNQPSIAVGSPSSGTLTPTMLAIAKEEVFSPAIESPNQDAPSEVLSGESMSQFDFSTNTFFVAGRGGELKEMAFFDGSAIAYRPLLQENGRISLFVSERFQRAEKAGRAFIGFDEQGEKKYADVPKVNVASLDLEVEFAPGECVLIYTCPVEAEADKSESLLKKARRVVGLSREPAERESNRTILATLIKVDRAKE